MFSNCVIRNIAMQKMTNAKPSITVLRTGTRIRIKIRIKTKIIIKPIIKGAVNSDSLWLISLTNIAWISYEGPSPPPFSPLFTAHDNIRNQVSLSLYFLMVHNLR